MQLWAGRACTIGLDKNRNPSLAYGQPALQFHLPCSYFELARNLVLSITHQGKFQSGLPNRQVTPETCLPDVKICYHTCLLLSPVQAHLFFFLLPYQGPTGWKVARVPIFVGSNPLLSRSEWLASLFFVSQHHLQAKIQVTCMLYLKRRVLCTGQYYFFLELHVIPNGTLQHLTTCNKLTKVHFSCSPPKKTIRTICRLLGEGDLRADWG